VAQFSTGPVRVLAWPEKEWGRGGEQSWVVGTSGSDGKWGGSVTLGGKGCPHPQDPLAQNLLKEMAAPGWLPLRL
jgi:hypothetical protein